ncbi:MAG: small ribosomal subunit Rsm22 family protein [Treponema sp.]|jgi:ribosomal protein RSM22 (predicted rRNA methylase)|nr:small ribosomal subunit Rsm22 family protein [Treponema sp.]
MFSYNSLPRESRHVLDSVPSLIEETFPIPGRFKKSLPSDIAELSRLLTDRRGERSLSYLSRANFLSAYLRYFLPWNLFRLCVIFPALDISLCSGDSVTDFGSGPLTFASALWISRPDLRAISIEINCIDRSGPALEAGVKFFNALCGDNSKWIINIIKEELDFRKPSLPARIKKGKKPVLIAAVNLFNEIYETLPHSNASALKKMAADIAVSLHNYASMRANILTVEPGVPQSGKFISLLRDEFIKLNRPPASPCPHTLHCPLQMNFSPSDSQKHPQTKNSRSDRKRWCHFAAGTVGVPKELHCLSAAAGIPKDRLVFSYLMTGKAQDNYSPVPHKSVRVLSDSFALPDYQYGRYCCGEKGLVLLYGERKEIEKTACGSLVTPVFAENGRRDKKSGALLAKINENINGVNK